MKKIKNITILGDGGWGTALAILLKDRCASLILWSVSKEYARLLKRERKNPKFLRGIRIPRQIKITADLRQATAKSDLIILAVPSLYLRKILRRCEKSIFVFEKTHFPAHFPTKIIEKIKILFVFRRKSLQKMNICANFRSEF